MKSTHISCDVCHAGEKVMSKTMQMVRDFDDCDGRTFYKHFSESTIDICSPCLLKVLESGKYLKDYRVMGYGEIKLEDKKCINKTT